MTWKLFLDDERNPSDVTWIQYPFDLGGFIVCRSSADAISEIHKQGSIPETISFDHDLGGDDTGMIFLNQIVELLISGQYQFPEKFGYVVHSKNPVGGGNIMFLMNNVIKNFAK